MLFYKLVNASTQLYFAEKIVLLFVPNIQKKINIYKFIYVDQ